MHVAKGVRGFSLVEVLVAMGVLSSALAGLAGLLVVAGWSDRTSRTMTTATLLATEKLERLQGDARLGASVGNGTEVVDANGLPVVDLRREPGSAAFVRRWSSGRLPLNPALLLISVMVAPWAGRIPDDPAHVAGSVSLSSVVRGTE